VFASYKAAPHNRYQPHPAEPAQHATCSNTHLGLLKMGIMMPKTCWESIDNKHLTVASCSFSLSLHNLLTMHGHRNLKLNFTFVMLYLNEYKQSTSRNFPPLVSRCLPRYICFCLKVVHVGCYQTLQKKLKQYRFLPSPPPPTASLWFTGVQSLLTKRRHRKIQYWPHNFTYVTVYGGERGSTVAKMLCYKSEVRWFDPSWCHWNFSLT